MSHYTNKSMFNRSLRSSTFKSKDQSTVPTVFMAVNKLKFEQDKLLEEHKRNRVLNRHISKDRANFYNEQRQGQYFSVVKHSARMDIEMKRSHQNKQIEQLKARYSMNMKNREENKKMIENVRQSFHQVNHQLYEQIRLKKKENQNLIKTERAKYMHSRAVSRMSAKEDKDMRRRSIQNFHESRSSERRSSKSFEIAEMLRKSEEKHKIYDVLNSQNSRIRESKLQSSRLSSSAKSQKNPENVTIIG